MFNFRKLTRIHNTNKKKKLIRIRKTMRAVYEGKVQYLHIKDKMVENCF